MQKLIFIRRLLNLIGTVNFRLIREIEIKHSKILEVILNLDIRICTQLFRYIMFN